MTQADTLIPTSHSPARGSDAVLVLGMHRSGTSAVARVLNLLGVELGGDLLPAAADNEAGFWEHRQIQFIHDRIYEVLKLDWTHVSPLPVEWWELPQVQPYRQQLKEILSRDFGSASLWGVKDPRLCAMMPLWRPLLAEMEMRPRCVLICRNPMEVVRSLGKRDQMSAARVYLLWLRSVIESERGSRGLPRTLTTFERVLSDWSGEVDRMSRGLDVTWPRPPAEVAGEVGDFIQPTSRHHQVDDDGFLTDDLVPALVRQLYSAILRAAEADDVDELSAAVDGVADELDHRSPLQWQFIEALEQEHRNNVIDKNLVSMRLGCEAADARAATAVATAESAAKDRHIADLQQQHAAEQQRLLQLQTELSAQIGELQQQQSALQQQLGDLQHQLAEKQSQLAASAGQIMSLEQDGLQMRATNLAQQDQLQHHRSELVRISTELDGYRIQRLILMQVLEKMQTSRAWRWSARALNQRWGPLILEDLIPVGSVKSLGENRWECSGPAHFVLPCLPIRGRVGIDLKLRVSIAGHANLYFDSGHLFNPGEHLDLGPVEGEMSIQREFTLPEYVHGFRLDPLDRTGAFTLLHLRIFCISK